LFIIAIFNDAFK